MDDTSDDEIYVVAVENIEDSEGQIEPENEDAVNTAEDPVLIENIKVESVSATSVTLTWDHHDMPGKEYHAACLCSGQHIQEQTTEVSTADFHNLNPGTNYTFQIATVLKNGRRSQMGETSAQTRTQLDCFLTDLGLEQFLSEKLCLSAVLQVDAKTVTDEPAQTLSSLPWCFLKKLIMANVTARSVKCSTSEKEDPMWNFENLENPQDTSHSINPLDIVTALFLCADDFLQQEIALKMSMCQFSVPLLLPNCGTKQIVFLLWALRDIVKKFRPHSLADPNGYVEERMVLCDLPMVSFVRLGDCSISKSQILNKLLSNPQQYHDTFIHRELDGGDSPRRISDGMVEISWYLPCGNKNIDVFPEPVAVANLRGDISAFETQYSFLCQTSSAVFVFFDNLDANDKLLTNQHVKAQTFLVVNAQTKNFNVERLKRMASEMRLEKHNVILRTKQNSTDFVKKLQSTINDVLFKNSPSKMQLEQMTRVAHELGILVDEDSEECQSAMENATGITSQIQDMIKFKEQLLPLQGKIWKDLAKLEKEECRLRNAGDQNIEDYKSDLKLQKMELRKRQNSFDMSEAMTCFLSALSSQRLERSYFLKWMRMKLDNLSGEKLSGLRELYKKRCQNSLKKKEDIDQLDLQISNSSLGIEHFVREMGQLYESTVSLPENAEARQQMRHLPNLYAQMLLDGFPLELVDGDASNIPLKWVSDVLHQLNALVQPNNKILVITVLGVQSTGKSTLLNTMFGVQFAVSSGRCTRGAFMLLIKVKDNFKNRLNCDYLVVIDTEGLKSPELSQLDDSFEHDNELATLVVGLSDLTIINIAMENSTEMIDTLQIVVHAFLRMKEVGKKPTCLFVHQNVADVSAHDKNMRGRKLLLEQLNEMTRAAAKMENKEEYCKFTDIIEYAPETNDCYIPCLWHGNPPMAPVSAGYSETVYELKKKMLNLLEKKCQSQTAGKTILEFLEWTKSLWNAVKHENFLFSFRNSLVADAYMRLCSEFNKWDWKFRKHMYTWLSEAEIRISNFEIIPDSLDIQDLLCELKFEATSELEKSEKNIHGNLAKYFEQKDNHVHLIERYKEDFASSTKSIRTAMQSSVHSSLDAAVEIKQGMSKLEDVKKMYADTIGHEALVLLEKCRKSNVQKSDTELWKVFEDMWQKTLNDVSLRRPTEKKIANDVFKVVRASLQNKGSSVAEELNQAKFDQCGEERFIVKPQGAFQILKSIVSDKDIQTMQKKADSIIATCKQIVREKVERNTDYNDTYTQEILHKIDERLTSFKCRETFEVSLTLHICGSAAREFQKMHDRFRRENDPRLQMEGLKGKYCSDFIDLFHERDQCQKRAKEFTDSCLRPAVKDWIARSLGIDIVEEMLRGNTAVQFSTRSFFQYSILTQLLTEGKFENYVRFTGSYEHFVKDLILSQIMEKMSKDDKIFTLEERTLKTVMGMVTEAVGEEQRQVTDKSTIDGVIKGICGRLKGKLVIQNFAMETILIPSHSDVKQFINNVTVFLEEMEASLKAGFREEQVKCKLQTLKIKPQNELFKRVFGCGEQCPFCCVPCEAGGEAHKDHFASIHRPEGLGSCHFVTSKKLVTDICSSSVFSEGSFRCHQTNDKFHPYKKYREVFPDWHIPADPSIEASNYWKYVMVKFNQQFATEYNTKPAKIPAAWKLITKENAQNSLKESFSIK